MISFTLTDEQAQIVAAVVDTLNRTPLIADPEARSSTDGSDHLEVGKLGSLGWVGIAAPESCGGSDATVVEEALIAREFGRRLVSPDVLATIIAATFALHAGDLSAARRFIGGEQAAAFGLPRTSGVKGTDAAYAVTQSDFVTHYVLVAGREPRVVSHKESIPLAPCIDPQLKTAVVPAADFVTVYETPKQIVEIGRRITILLAATLAGMAEASRDLAVDYAKTRKQFGRAIGSFQAIKHHCADMHVRARTASSQTMYAAMLLASDAADAQQQVLAAFEVATAAAIRNAEVGIQIHGAMGFSAECLIHRYLKRSHVLRLIGTGALAMQPSVVGSLRRNA